MALRRLPDDQTSAPRANLCRMVRHLAVLAFLLAACSDDPHSAGSPLGPSTASHVTEGANTLRATRAETLDCRRPIGELEAPGERYEIIGGAVALVTSASSPIALQTSATKADPAKRLFAKTGLLVKTGAKSELIVPPEWADQLSVGWGNTDAGQPSQHLVVGPCDSGAAWIAFPGGYFISDPACVDLIVRVADKDRHRSIGVGAPCPGQRQPPEPTED